MNRKYRVIGYFEGSKLKVNETTIAPTEAKAITNIRYRIKKQIGFFPGQFHGTVKEETK